MSSRAFGICFRKCVNIPTRKPSDVAHFEKSLMFFFFFLQFSIEMVLCHVALLWGVWFWAIFLEVWALGCFLGLWAMKPRALVGSHSSPQILVENSRHNFIAHVLCSPPDMYPRAERHSRQGTAQHRKLKQTKACVQAKRDEHKKRGVWSSCCEALASLAYPNCSRHFAWVE